MYPVSELFAEKIKENNRVFQCKVQIQHSQGVLDLTDKDLVLGSLLLAESSQAGDEFTVGGTVAADLSLSFLNKSEYEDIEFEGATVIPQVALLLGEGQEYWEWVPLGVFNIDDPVKLRNTIRIKAIDNMIKFDKPYNLSQLSYPATLYQIYVNACNVCDVNVATLDFPNKDYVVQERPEDDYTFRDIIGYVAELAGCFAKCNRTGALEIRWYENTGLELGPMNRFDFKPKDYQVKIKGIMATVDDTVYLTGTDDYAIDLSDNPLLQSDYETVLPNILNHIGNTVFTPCDSRWQGNPAVMAGDLVNHTDRDGNEYATLITHSTYKYRGASTMSAKGLPERARGFKGSTNKKIAQIKRKIEKEVGDKLTTLEQAQLNATELMTNMLGGHIIEDTENGILYIADNPDLELATKIWKWGTGGFGYSDDGGETYTTAITADGSIVASLISAGLITADMVQTGLLSSEDGTTWINLDTGAFNFKDALKWVNEELIIASSQLDELKGHQILLSNENQSIITDSSGVIASNITIQSDIDVFRGITKVGATIGNLVLKNSSGTTISFGTLSKVNPTSTISGSITWTLSANTNISDDFGWIEIPITVEDKSYTKKLTWNKSKAGTDGAQGAPGSPGAPAKTVNITATNAYFSATINSSGNIAYSPSSITLKAQFENCTYSRWNYSYNGSTMYVVTSGSNGLTISGQDLIISNTSSLFSSQSSIVFRAISTTGEYDLITIARLSDIEDTLMQNYYYNKTKISQEEGIEVYDNLNNKVLQVGGINVTSATGTVKNAYGFKAVHSDGTFSAVTKDGFYKKYLYGEGKYLNDIFIYQKYSSPVFRTTPPPTTRISLPQSFRGRGSTTKVIPVSTDFYLSGGGVSRYGDVRSIIGYHERILDIVASDFTSATPYVDVDSYVEFEDYNMWDNWDGEYGYHTAGFVLIVIGY